MSYMTKWTAAFREEWAQLPDEAKLVVANLEALLRERPLEQGRPLDHADSADLRLFEHREPGVSVIFRVSESDPDEAGGSSNGEGVVKLIRAQLVYFAPPKVVFVTYSHKDKHWKEQLEAALQGTEWGRQYEVWSDDDIDPGDLWKEKIKEKLNLATGAILLVSEDFLASKFISEVELPKLLKRAKKDGTKILWLPVRECKVPGKISKYQWLAETPLDKSENDGILGSLLETVVENIRIALEGS